MSSSETHKLSRRIAVHDKYALGAAIHILSLGLFKNTDTICAKIAQYYQSNKRSKINSMQLATLKKRMPAYAGVLWSNGGIPDSVLAHAEDCTATVIDKKQLQNSKNNYKTADISNNTRLPQILLKFKFDPVVIEQLKKLDAPKFDKANNIWKIRATIPNCEQLIEYGFTFSVGLTAWYRKYCYKFFNEPNPDIRIRGLKHELRPFQKYGVAYALSRNNRALIGDDMGLGKTVQGIGWLQAIAYERPALIICPASLKYNWAKEIKEWVNDPTIYVLYGAPDRNDSYQQMYENKYLYRKGKSKNVFIVINYDIIPNVFEKTIDTEGKKIKSEVRDSRWVDFLKKSKIKSVVLDEAQYIKNKEANRTAAVISFCKNVDNILALSGTPIDNRPIEFFTLLNLLNPFQFANKLEYAKRYCNAKHNGYGWDFNGSSNLRELHDVVSKAVMVRRLKDEVLTELPPKRRIIVDIDIDNRKEYDKASADVVSYFRSMGFDEKAIAAERAKTLVKINTLMQLSISGKIKNCIEWIRTFLESGEKLVVFATHTRTIELLLKEFKHVSTKGGIAVVVDGSTPQKERQWAVETFQENEQCRLFFGNLIAAGVGLTLTRASNTCFLELGMVPSHHLQAEDRVHRIGQTADSVGAYYLVARNTIEANVAEILSSKYEVLKMTLDGIEISEEEQNREELGMLVDVAKSIEGFI